MKDHVRLKALKRRKTFRSWGLGLLAGTFLLGGALNCRPHPGTPVEIQVRTRYLKINFEKESPALGSLSMRELKIEPLSEIEFSQPMKMATKIARPDTDSTHSLYIRGKEANQIINVDLGGIPGKSSLEIECLEKPGHMQFKATGKGNEPTLFRIPDLFLALPNSVKVEFGDISADTVFVDQKGPWCRVRPSGHQLVFIGESADDSVMSMLTETRADGVGFSKSDLVIGGETATGWSNKIIDGTIYIDALDGFKYELRRGEQLEIVNNGQIEILDLSIKKDHMSLVLSANVNSLNVGANSYPRELNPNRLTWLSHTNGFRLLWPLVIGLLIILVEILLGKS